jgi:membrane-associated phospholipid phosphatase
MHVLWRFTFIVLGVHPALAAAQVPRPAVPDSSAPAVRPIAMPRPASRSLRWWEAVATAGVTVAVMSQDEQTTEELLEHPTRQASDLASAFRRVGQPEVYAALPAAVIATGLVAGDGRITRAGGRLAASVIASTVAFETVKLVAGRARPDDSRSSWEFSPFSGRGSFPSGHSTVAFALATSLSHELHNPLATVALYATATGTAWSRVYNRRHWASDVVFGAALGIATAQVVHGRWRVFGLRPPGFLLEPAGAGLRVTVPVGAGR